MIDRELLQEALDAMPQHVALIEADGRIRLVNGAWLRFARDNGHPAPTAEAFLGANYLSVLENVTGTGADRDLAMRSAAGIRAVLDAEQARFSLGYPCNSETEERWFIFDVTPLKRLGGAVVVHTNITERKLQERRLAQLAHFDSLTGLASRSFFLARAEHLLTLARRHGRQLALLYLDLDGFKRVNDTLGHEAGDELLAAVAKRLAAQARESDLLARLGGDEFAALVEDGRGAEIIGWRYARTLDAPFALGAAEVTVRASIGVARFPLHGRTVPELLRLADAAMYDAKRAGGGVRLAPAEEG